MEFQERRRAKRVEARLSITISGGPEETKGETLNISTNGVYFKSPYYIEPLTKVRLELMIPQPEGSEKPVSCDGIVVRVEPEKKDPSVKDYNIAVFFTSVSEQSQKVLADYIVAKLS